MTDPLLPFILQHTSATSARRAERVQGLWDGYGEVVRYALEGAEAPSVILKHVDPPKGRGRGHDRKLRSYEIEQAWYTRWASKSQARLAECLHAEREGGQWRFLFEDLDAAGFDRRARSPRGPQLEACLRWLAMFHASFMGERPKGIWKIGTYWHLKTRPDEHKAMEGGPLKAHAAAIDARLNAARFQTFVHGDAKPANFCFSRDGQRVAAVDFQYVGGGVGVKDVTYLLSGESTGTVKRGLDVYFKALRAALPSEIDGAAVEAEWRALYPWAWADFERFLAGWAPGWRVARHERGYTQGVLRSLG